MKTMTNHVITFVANYKYDLWDEKKAFCIDST